jgi:hypothetical protein
MIDLRIARIATISERTMLLEFHCGCTRMATKLTDRPDWTILSRGTSCSSRGVCVACVPRYSRTDLRL